MSNPTSNFGWQMPTATDLVTDLPADFEVFGQAVDTDFADLNGGTTGQILSKTSATDLDFTWVTPNAGDITGVTAGIGISGGGTSGTVTVTNSMATAIDAKGDLVAGTGADTFSRLAIGSNNTILTADSAEATGMKWATPAAAGGMTLISETTASALSSLSFSSLGSYKQLLLEWQGIYHSNSATRFDLRFNSDGGGNYLGNNVTSIGATFTVRSAPADTAVSFYAAFGENTDLNPSAYVFNSYGSLLIDNYTSTTKLKKFKIIHWFYNNTSGDYTYQLYSDRYYNSLSAITSLDVVRTSGSGTFSNQTNTSIRLYGIS